MGPMSNLAMERHRKYGGDGEHKDEVKAKIYAECIQLTKILMGRDSLASLVGMPASIAGSVDAVRYRLADIAVWSQTGYMFEPGTWMESLVEYEKDLEKAGK